MHRQTYRRRLFTRHVVEAAIKELICCGGAHLLVSHGVGRCEEGREHLHALQQCFVEVLEEVGIGQAPVPVLYNVTSIHDLPKDVPQIIPRNLHNNLKCHDTRIGQLAFQPCLVDPVYTSVCTKQAPKTS